MAKKRKGLSQRTRFEIFKRDGFKCLYCGSTPVQKVLRVDHVVPVKEGGGDGPENLVTSCFDCNAGKAAEPLDRKKFTAAIATEADKEHAEQIREYLAVQREVAKSRDDARRVVADYWEERIGPLSEKMFGRLERVVREWPYSDIIEAIEITASKFGDPDAEFKYRTAETQARYFQAILRNWREGNRF